MSEIKAFRLKKYLIQSFIKFLDFPLSFKNGGRLRAKFIKAIRDIYDATEKERMEHLLSIAERDDKGSPVIRQVTVMRGGRPVAENHFQLSPENETRYNKWETQLWQEEAVIDLLPSMEQGFTFTKNLFLEIDKELGVTDEQHFVAICEAFEKV